MKLVLAKDGVKREIEAPFGLCVSSDDLETFIGLLREARAVMGSQGASFGWVRIDPSHPADDASDGHPPLKWTDGELIVPPVEVVGLEEDSR